MEDPSFLWSLFGRAVLEVAGRRWACICGCSLGCAACLELLEAVICGAISEADYRGHQSLHGPNPLRSLLSTEPSGPPERTRVYEGRGRQLDVVDLMTRPLGYRLIRGHAMSWPGDS